MAVPKKSVRLLFFDKRGKFMSPKDRFTKDVAKVYVNVPERKKGYFPLSDQVKGKLTYKRLAFLLRSSVGDTRAERALEKLPPVLVPKRGDVRAHGNAKYIAWHIAGDLGKTRGITGKLVKVTMKIKDGKKYREISFYHNMSKKGGSFQYQLWKRMNEAIGMEGQNFYKEFRGKLLSDRKGKTVKLISADLELVQ